MVLSASDTKLESVLPYFTERGVDVAFLVPTMTGLQKSIMDATATVRQFLKRNNLHDFDEQGQGQKHKKLLKTYLVNVDYVRETETSLYRPETKKGDPRIWFLKLSGFCVPNNLLALFVIDKELYVLNLSDSRTIQTIEDRKSEIYYLLDDASGKQSNSVIADELLSKLIAIHNLGFIKTLVAGDTGIGMTLENLLGIPPNSSKNPDYKGIELKSQRGSIGVRTRNRSSLFSQAPSWDNSCIKTAQKLLDIYGYMRDGRQQLYCTVESSRPNSQGLYFHLDEDQDILFNRYQNSQTDEVKEVVQWEMANLRNRLEEKHNETFWVKAESKFMANNEYFRYDQVMHTRRPNINQMGTLFEANIITMDYTLSQQKTRVRDHGYLFKIKPENLNLLFPSPRIYRLEDVSEHVITLKN